MRLFIIHNEVRYEVTVPSDASTIGQLKERIRADSGLAPLARNKVIRLIAGGRILANDAASLAACRIEEDGGVHCVLSDSAMPAQRGRGPPFHPLQRQGSSSGGDEASPDSESIRAASWTGFARLQLLGLDTEEVAALRHLYLPDVTVRFPPAVLPPLPGETEAERMLRAEDAWMRTQDPERSEFALNLRPLVLARFRGSGDEGFLGRPSEDGGAAAAASSSGTTASFLCGLLLGITVGAMSLFIALFLSNAPGNRRFKLGVFVGAVLNIVYVLLMSAASAAEGEERGVVPPDAPDMVVVGPGLRLRRRQ